MTRIAALYLIITAVFLAAFLLPHQSQAASQCTNAWWVKASNEKEYPIYYRYTGKVRYRGRWRKCWGGELRAGWAVLRMSVRCALFGRRTQGIVVGNPYGKHGAAGWFSLTGSRRGKWCLAEEQPSWYLNYPANQRSYKIDNPQVSTNRKRVRFTIRYHNGRKMHFRLRQVPQ